MNRSIKFMLMLVGLGVFAGGTLLWRNSPSRIPTRVFEFQYATYIPVLPEGSGVLRVWIPVPESDNEQEISQLSLESRVPYQLHRDPEYGNLYAYLEVDARTEPGPTEVTMRFRVKRREHRVAPDAPAKNASTTAIKTAERVRLLQPDHLVPTDGVIAALSEQETRGLTQPLDKAHAIYNYVVSTMRYDKSGEGWGRGDAIYACNNRKGNCTDFHALFIGMMRAAGIPARFEIGFPLPRDREAADIPGYHCWAQFYLDEVGWVPVDASEAWKDPARRSYFFGAHDENRVLFSRGRDIRFNPPQQGEAVNYFIYPYAELDGRPFAGLEHQFSFRDLAP